MLALVHLCVIRSGQLSRKSHASVAVLVSGSAHIDHRSGQAGRVVWVKGIVPTSNKEECRKLPNLERPATYSMLLTPSDMCGLKDASWRSARDRVRRPAAQLPGRRSRQSKTG
jgi:hypothetical protein